MCRLHVGGVHGVVDADVHEAWRDGVNHEVTIAEILDVPGDSEVLDVGGARGL